MKKKVLSTLIISMCLLTACSSKKDDNREKTKIDTITEKPTIAVAEDIPALADPTEDETATADPTEVKTTIADPTEDKTTLDDSLENDTSSEGSGASYIEPKIKDADYSEYFNGLDGCAVIYDPESNEASVYNQSMMNTEVSPFSTFKIVSTLAGLKHGVLKDQNSTMNYNGTEYPMEQWNHNLTLKEAFQNSCVWYYRQVIDAIGQDAMQKELDELGYGNCDISEWAGISEKPGDELSGFWLDSSLKISPMEQVTVLAKIFEKKSQFTEEQIDILKDIMLFDETKDYSIYGKTGTKSNQQGWYVGFALKDNKKQYFAVYVNGEKTEKNATGAVARTIVKAIFS